MATTTNVNHKSMTVTRLRINSAFYLSFIKPLFGYGNSVAFQTRLVPTYLLTPLF